MKLAHGKEASEIWNNGEIPVMLRRGGSKPTRIRVPYRDDNRQYLRNGPKKQPAWDKVGKYWELPASRFDELVKLILNRFGEVYIIQPFREKEVCAPSCINAKGFKCECSCFGANHASGNNDGWYEVSDSLALRWGESKLGCRLLSLT